jgi:hypothetical protein
MAIPATAWLTSAIEAADAATQALGMQETVTVERGTPPDAYGDVLPGSDPEAMLAFVQRKEGLMKTRDGKEHSFRAIVTFLRPTEFSTLDTITLWDGITGPVLVPLGGMSDPETGQPYVRTVHVGQR